MGLGDDILAIPISYVRHVRSFQIGTCRMYQTFAIHIDYENVILIMEPLRLTELWESGTTFFFNQCNHTVNPILCLLLQILDI